MRASSPLRFEILAGFAVIALGLWAVAVLAEHNLQALRTRDGTAEQL